MAEKSNYDKMISGALHNGADPVFMELKQKAAAKKAVLDAIPFDDIPARTDALEGLVGSIAGPCLIMPPFTVEYGIHLHLGEWVFINFGATFLDSAPITIGSRTAIGPNVQFLTATHPVRPEERIIPTSDDQFPPFIVMNQALPITIGSHCWIGAGAILMPGIEIGDGAVIGAGSVVTRSVPPRKVAAGNPARILRSVDDP